MQTPYLKFKVWVESTNRLGEKLEVVISEIMTSDRLNHLLDALDFEARIYRKKTHNFPLGIEYKTLEENYGISFGEFQYNKFLFFKRTDNDPN